MATATATDDSSSSSEFDAMKTFTEYTTRATKVTSEGLYFIGEHTGEYFRTSSHENLLHLCLSVEAVFSLAFLISAFVLGTNSYAGFTAIFTGLVFMGYIWCTYYGLKYHKSRTVYGALMGAGLFLTVLALETAIFWGEYSKCSPGKSLADLYNNECSNTSAMISACVFAVFMFLTLLVQLVLLFMYRDAILGTGPLNEGLGVGASASNKQQPAAGPYSSVGQAADDDTVSVTFDGSSQSHNQSHNSNRGQHLTSVDL